MERNLRITGSATKKYSPDTVKVYMHLDAVAKNAELAKKVFTSKSTLMTNIINQLGFNADDLRTENFYVDKNYEYKDNQRIQNGYKADCTYSLMMDLDYTALDNLITGLSQALQMRITYDVLLKDREKEEKAVLELAVEDAKKRAEYVANACGVKLGKIVGINYEGNYGCAAFRTVNASEQNLAPSDVTITKSIELMWEII